MLASEPAASIPKPQSLGATAQGLLLVNQGRAFAAPYFGAIVGFGQRPFCCNLRAHPKTVGASPGKELSMWKAITLGTILTAALMLQSEIVVAKNV